MTILSHWTAYGTDESEECCNLIILRSPNGTLYKLTADDSGVLSTTEVTE